MHYHRPAHLLLLTLLASCICLGMPVATAADSAPGSGGKMQYRWRDRVLTNEQYQAILKYQEASKAMTAGDWAAARDKLRQVVAIMPDLYEGHTNLSIALTSLGDLQGAETEADIAYRLAPNQPEPLLAKATVAQSFGRLDEALGYYKLFVKDFPSHRLAPQAKGFVQELTGELASQRAAGKVAKHSNNADDDYFDYATVEAVVKWPADKFPLKVYIPSDESCTSIPGYQPEFGTAVHHAFDAWQSASKDRVSFAYINKPDNADINCTWTNDTCKVKTPAEGGDAYVLYHANSGIVHVNITLLTIFAGQVSKTSHANMVGATALHEIGHSLGLIGHSPYPDDIMFCALPAADASKPLSDRDMKTIEHLYSNDVTIAVHNPVPSTSTNKGSLNNEGTILASQQKFNQAVEKFRAALKLDPKFEPAKQNLAAALNNLAISATRDGKYDDGVAKFKEALSFASPSDKRSRASIMLNLALALEKSGNLSEADTVRKQAQQLQNGN